MVALARIHAPVFGDLALAATEWLNQPNPLNQALLTALLPGFLERYGDRIAPEHAEVCERFVAPPTHGTPTGGRHSASSTATTGSTTCSSTTGAARSSTGRPGLGPVMRDAAYFIGGALPVEERRAHEESLCAPTTTSSSRRASPGSHGSSAGRSTGANASCSW